MSATVTDNTSYIEWDVGNWSAALGFWKRHTTLDLSRVDALELGSRNGGLSLWLARQGARVTCSDLTIPTATARDLHSTGDVSGRISYAAVDATALTYAERFDVVMFKSVLGGLGGDDAHETQHRAVAGMHRALRLGGELFFAENLVASPVHRLLRRRFVPWQHWRYVSLAETLGFLAPFREVSYRTVGFSAAFGRTEHQRSVLGTLDRALLDRLVPERWRYVVVGVARK